MLDQTLRSVAGGPDVVKVVPDTAIQTESLPIMPKTITLNGGAERTNSITITVDSDNYLAWGGEQYVWVPGSDYSFNQKGTLYCYDTGTNSWKMLGDEVYKPTRKVTPKRKDRGVQSMKIISGANACILYKGEMVDVSEKFGNDGELMVTPLIEGGYIVSGKAAVPAKDDPHKTVYQQYNENNAPVGSIQELTTEYALFTKTGKAIGVNHPNSDGSFLKTDIGTVFDHYVVLVGDTVFRPVFVTKHANQDNMLMIQKNETGEKITIDIPQGITIDPNTLVLSSGGSYLSCFDFQNNKLIRISLEVKNIEMFDIPSDKYDIVTPPSSSVVIDETGAMLGLVKCGNDNLHYLFTGDAYVKINKNMKKPRLIALRDAEGGEKQVVIEYTHPDSDNTVRMTINLGKASAVLPSVEQQLIAQIAKLTAANETLKKELQQSQGALGEGAQAVVSNTQGVLGDVVNS